MYNVAGLAGILAAIVLASRFQWAFHRDWLHRLRLPKECFTSRTPIHHVPTDRNHDVLSSLADLPLGTLVLVRAAPGSTPDGARTLARRHSRFGRRLRDLLN